MSKFKFLNATSLKIIALILMIFDHIYEMFYFVGAPIWLKAVGRVVFPIFLFLAADGFYYTKDKTKYIKRLFIASVLMGIGNSLLSYFMPNDNIVLMNNAFSTFFVAVLFMLIWDKIIEFKNTKNVKELFKVLGIILLIILLTLPYILILVLGSFEEANINQKLIMILVNIALIIPNLITVEGGIVMVLLGLFFYIFREKRLIQYIGYLALSLLIIYRDPSNIQGFMIFALPFMIFYNGKKGKGYKWLFYIIYPVHIYLLYLISTLVVKG